MARYSNAVSRFNRDDVERMAAEGRRPSYDSAGNVRGFRTKPGATQSIYNRPGSGPREATEDPYTGLTNEADWRAKGLNPYFKPTPTAPPVASAPAAEGAMTTDPTQMPPPGSFSEQDQRLSALGYKLSPEGPTDAAGMASLSPRPFTQPRNPLHEAVARHKQYLESTKAPYLSQSAEVTPLGMRKSFRTKYGTGSVRPGAEVDYEKSKQLAAQRYKAELDSITAGALM